MQGKKGPARMRSRASQHALTVTVVRPDLDGTPCLRIQANRETLETGRFGSACTKQAQLLAVALV